MLRTTLVLFAAAGCTPLAPTPSPPTSNVVIENARVVVMARGQGSPELGVAIDGVLVTSRTLPPSEAVTGYPFTLPTFSSNSRLAIVFMNEGAARTLSVSSIAVNGKSLSSTSMGVVYDRGSRWEEFFDGVDTMPGRELLPQAGALIFPPIEFEPVRVRAFGSTANGEGPTMIVRADGVTVAEVEVSVTSPRDFSFGVVRAPRTFDVAFLNHLKSAREERVLFLNEVEFGGRRVEPDAPGVVFDLGDTEATAFDGLNLEPGRGALHEAGALRFGPIVGGGTGGGSAGSAGGGTGGGTAGGSVEGGGGGLSGGPAGGGMAGGSFGGGGAVVLSRADVTMMPASTIPLVNYLSADVGPYRIVDNIWGVAGLPTGWRTQVGLVNHLRSDGAACGRMVWSFPTTTTSIANGPGATAFPLLVYGRHDRQTQTAGAALPQVVRTLNAVDLEVSAYDEQSVSGRGQLTLDLWLSAASFMTVADRRHEIMIPLQPYAGYGVPDSPPAAVAGRESQLATGRNMRFYKGRFTIDGVEYDVTSAPPGNGTAWAFSVFMPVRYGANRTVRIKPLLDWLVANGYADASQWLVGTELGVETVPWLSTSGSPVPSAGDVFFCAKTTVR